MAHAVHVTSTLRPNQNQNSTQVHLADNNFEVVQKVTGSAEVNYVLLVGGINKRQLYENAYADIQQYIRYKDEKS